MVHRLQFRSQQSSVSRGSASVASTLKYCRILWYLGNVQCKFHFGVRCTVARLKRLVFTPVGSSERGGLLSSAVGGKAFCSRASASPRVPGRERCPPGRAVGGLECRRSRLGRHAESVRDGH